jgi:hypothetical protein
VLAAVVLEELQELQIPAAVVAVMLLAAAEL